MKKSKVSTFFEKIEKEDEVLKRWGDNYKLEKNIILMIIETRKKKGLTQKQLGELVNLNQSAIARIEARIHSPQLDTIIKIIDALDMKLEITNKDDNPLEKSIKTIQTIIDDTYTPYSLENFTKVENFYVEIGGFDNGIYSHTYQDKKTYIA
ncbi:MAG: helix-turn-helix transcriptional regulator [Acholeplasmataceae bacterium]